jgi:hypothetical protein
MHLHYEIDSLLSDLESSVDCSLEILRNATISIATLQKP